MNKKTLLILCVLFVAVMVIAGMLYNSLAGQMQTGGIVTTPPATEAPTIPSQEPTQATEAPQTEVPQEPEGTEAPANAAPDFTMLDWEGNEVRLTDFFGKPIILNFWASWCGPCKMEMPDLEAFYQQYGEQIHFLIVNCTDGSRETVDTAKEFIESTDYTFPVYFDTTSMGAYTYGASSIPLTFFIDAEGNPVAYYMGAMSADILQQGVDAIYTPETSE